MLSVHGHCENGALCRVLLVGALSILGAGCGDSSGPLDSEPDSVVGLLVGPDTLRLNVGETSRLTARLLLSSGDTTEADKVAWVALTPQVAQVDSAGLVEALSPGRGKILATAEGLTVQTIVYVPGWFTSAALPQPRRSGHAAAFDGKVYYIGGNTGTVDAYSASTFVFDPESQRWSTLPPMPTPRDHGAFVVAAGRIYVIGGINPSAPNNGFSRLWANERFRGAAGVWEVREPMPTARGGVRADTLGGLIYVIGGTTVVEHYDTVEIYDPASNTWAAGPAMSTARWSFAVGSIDGKLYLAGGEVVRLVATGSMAIFNPADGSWSEGPPMPTARFRTASAVVGGMLVVMGGLIGAGPPVAAVEAFDPAEGTWSILPPLPVARSDIRAAVVDGIVYVLGGLTETGTTARVDGYLP